jgi:hypothetical protein
LVWSALDQNDWDNKCKTTLLETPSFWTMKKKKKKKKPNVNNKKGKEIEKKKIFL